MFGAGSSRDAALLLTSQVSRCSICSITIHKKCQSQSSSVSCKIEELRKSDDILRKPPKRTKSERGIQASNKRLALLAGSPEPQAKLTKLESTSVARAGNDTFLRILVLGDPGVGKTSSMIRFARDQFEGDHVNVTIGNDTANVRLKHSNDTNVVIQIVDTGGQETFRKGFFS